VKFSLDSVHQKY